MNLLNVEKFHSDRWRDLGFEALDDIEKEYIGLYWFIGEVNNGGFDQYFFNSSGDLAQESLAALLRLSDAVGFEILTSAMEAIPGGWVSDQSERNNRCEPFWDDEQSPCNLKLEECNRKFYALEMDHLQEFLPLLANHYGQEFSELSDADDREPAGS